MIDATETNGQLPTDLAEPHLTKPDMSTGLPRVDLGDRDQVFDLALELQTATRRRLQQVTFREMKAIARLAVLAAPVLSHAEALHGAADPSNGPELQALLRVTGQMIQAQRGPKGA